jgi:uncharacterized protein YjbI with pentapeptide repeats
MLVANEEHLHVLRRGVEVWPDWNSWRTTEPAIVPDLSGADLSQDNLILMNLSGANLSGAILRGNNLSHTNLSSANLSGANLEETILHNGNLCGASLNDASLTAANLDNVNCMGANLSKAYLRRAYLFEANLSGAVLIEADLTGANLARSNLSRANLSRSNLAVANLIGANLSGANLKSANLMFASLTHANLADAVLTGCRIHGVSAWKLGLNEGTKQQDLVITDLQEPDVTVDNMEVAQFVYLLLHNEKIRDVIDAIGKKGVLLLGRFTEGRIAVLERLRDELRKRGYLPIVFNFDKPETKDFTETVRLLAGLSKFVIADLSDPKSAPYELGAIVSQTMIPFQPIITSGETPFSMLQDLWINHQDRVFRPIHYSSVDALIASLDEKIIRPAEARFVELVKRKADTMGGEHV